ncbi:MAG TPA: DUF4432 family protein [Planctomycetes bacterium]|nr:DUF4432 family protein [Planctomycetota bacterium]
MAEQSWILTDCDSRTYRETFSTQGENYSLTKTTLRGGLQEGVDIVEVDNGLLKFTVLPTRGMGLWKAAIGDWDVGWKSPVRGPVNPAFVDIGEPSGLAWLDGFDELLVRCGLESNGAPEFDDNGTLLYPLHGRIGNRPAHYVRVAVDEEAQTLTVTGVVEETRFHFLKLRMTSVISTQLGSSKIGVQDTIENLSSSDAESQMLYHFNIGAPTLDAGSTLIVPAKRIVPRNDHAATGIESWNNYQAEQVGYEEQVYFLELHANEAHRTGVLLKNAHGTRGISLGFDKRRLPCFTVWKNTTSITDGYVTGIEPGTNFPNPRSYEGENDRFVRLPPHGKISYDLDITLHDGAESVDTAEAGIRSLQAAPAKVFDKPQPGWCAD